MTKTQLLLIGHTGQLGQELQKRLEPLCHLITCSRQEMELSNADSIRNFIRQTQPDIIINAAAYTAVDKAEQEEEQAMQINGIAPGIIAEEAKQLGSLLIHYSTDYIFDGRKSGPYQESDPCSPINSYGRSKLAGEEAVTAVGGDHLIFRTCWVYASHSQNFLQSILRLAHERQRLTIVNDQFGTPTWAGLIADITLQAIQQTENERAKGVFKSDIFNLTAEGETSWFNFAKAIIEQAETRLPDGYFIFEELLAIPTSGYPTPAERPANSVLDNRKLKQHFNLTLPTWQETLKCCLRELN